MLKNYYFGNDIYFRKEKNKQKQTKSKTLNFLSSTEEENTIKIMTNLRLGPVFEKFWNVIYSIFFKKKKRCHPKMWVSDTKSVVDIISLFLQRIHF